MNDPFPSGIITEVPDGIIIRLHLQPRASKTEICGVQGDELKARVTSPPVDDAANRLCIEFFSKLFKSPKSAISIISGQKSRHKRLQIHGTDCQAASYLLNSILTAKH